eukprot:365350-Chlamydomonas_euryale.AAC.7
MPWRTQSIRTSTIACRPGTCQRYRARHICPPPRTNNTPFNHVTLQDAPDIIVSTPAALVGFLNEAGPRYGWLWSPEGMEVR